MGLHCISGSKVNGADSSLIAAPDSRIQPIGRFQHSEKIGMHQVVKINVQ